MSILSSVLFLECESNIVNLYIIIVDVQIEEA